MFLKDWGHWMIDRKEELTAICTKGGQILVNILLFVSLRSDQKGKTPITSNGLSRPMQQVHQISQQLQNHYLGTFHPDVSPTSNLAHSGSHHYLSFRPLYPSTSYSGYALH